MLISFKARNFLSFGEETEFTMLPAEGIRRYGHRVSETPFGNIRKVAAIYGGNGTGKSNLLKAVNFLKDRIFNQEIESSDFDLYRNKLLEGSRDIPIFLEIKFFRPKFSSNNLDSVVYTYSIEFNKEIIISEIFSYSDIYDSELIALKNKGTNKSSDSGIGKSNFRIVDNHNLSLGLWDFNSHSEKNKDHLVRALAYLYHDNMDIEKGQSSRSYLNELFNDKVTLDLFKSLICNAHTGITKIDVKEFNIEEFFGEVNREKIDSINRMLRSKDNANGFFEVYEDSTKDYLYYFLKDGKVFLKKLAYFHKGGSQNFIEFSREIESDGTKRILELAPKLLALLFDENKTLLIDEIENSIHPALLKEFITKLLNFPVFRGQLIFTTHESNLLDQDIFRQDEIWFAEKDEKGFSHFHPLSDYDIRNDLDIQKGYLNGRFGGMPFLSNLKDLKWNKSDTNAAQTTI